jgi:hypothetical protein
LKTLGLRFHNIDPNDPFRDLLSWRKWRIYGTMGFIEIPQDMRNIDAPLHSEFTPWGLWDSLSVDLGDDWASGGGM